MKDQIKPKQSNKLLRVLKSIKELNYGSKPKNLLSRIHHILLLFG